MNRGRLLGRIALYAVLAGAAGAGAYMVWGLEVPDHPDRAPDAAYFEELAKKRQRVWSRVGDDPAFARLEVPRGREWLKTFREKGQDLDEYKEQLYNRKTAQRRTIRLIVLGEQSAFLERALPVLVDYLGRFFGCDARFDGHVPLPPETLNATRRQHDAARILSWLTRQRPDDAVVYAAITESDLYVPDLNFVFGLGSLGERVGVFSTRRFGDAYPEKLRRNLQLVAHELGHIFSMQHCVYYACTMNGSNSLAETDRQPLHLCPVCLQKIAYANGLDVADRYRKLADFYAAHGFAEEARWCGERLGETGRL
jgi:archaemetzincin